MPCSVCNSLFTPTDYCNRRLSTSDTLAELPNLTTISLLCATCYEQIKATLLLQQEKDKHDITILEKQLAWREKAAPLCTSPLIAEAPLSKLIGDAQQDIRDEEQKIKELEEQLRLQSLIEWDSSQPPYASPIDAHAHLNSSQQLGSIRALFTFNDAVSAINGFSLLQLEPAQVDKIGDVLQVQELFSDTVVPLLRNRDSINAGLAELSLCIQMIYQATFREIYNTPAMHQCTLAASSGPSGLTLFSVLVAALPAPLIIVYHTGISPSILRPIQHNPDLPLKKIKKASRTICELAWERPNANAMFAGSDRDAFILGLGALLGFLVDMYIFFGMESPCAVTISKQLLNMYSNLPLVVECYSPELDGSREGVGKKKPLLLNPLYVSSTVFNDQTLRKLNIEVVSGTDKKSVSIDGVSPSHPSAGSEQWNSYICKFVVMCSYMYGHVMNLIHQ